MSFLADAFSDDDRRRFANDNVKIGAVLKVFVADTRPPKEKRLIIVGESYDHVSIASIYINTELNVNVFPNKELKDLNLEFAAVGRAYLDHRSFVDCSNLHVLSKESLTTILLQDPTRLLGDIETVDLNLIRTTIKNAKTIKPSLKKTFGLFL